MTTILIMIVMLMSYLGELLVVSLSSAEVRLSITFPSNSCLVKIMVMIINISCLHVMDGQDDHHYFYFHILLERMKVEWN